MRVDAKAALRPWPSALLAWYRRHRRPLPWRKDVSPYQTWISEIMLQQTTVRTVLPYYRRFLERFPDIPALAAASEERVLQAWAGLGYYSRARNLLAAARAIMAEHGGAFPGKIERVLALPGIGRYTAGAILSIAFDQPHPVLDGNVLRVLCRLYGIKSDVKKGPAQRRLWALAASLVPARRPGDWNQALMELGATVCLPESPACGLCPVAASCLARRRGEQDRIPRTGSRRKPVDLRWTCLWIEKDGKVLLWRRSERERFLKDHWGLPEARHLRVSGGRLLKTVRHVITHHRIALEVRAAAAPARLPEEAAWVERRRLKERLVSSLWFKAIRED